MLPPVLRSKTCLLLLALPGQVVFSPFVGIRKGFVGLCDFGKDTGRCFFFVRLDLVWVICEGKFSIGLLDVRGRGVGGEV